MSFPTAKMLSTGMGVCTCHNSPRSGTGIVIIGSTDVFTNGLPTGRMLDTVLFPDGHSGILIGGSGTVFTNGLPTARMLDNFVGCFSGILIDGATDVFTGG